MLAMEASTRIVSPPINRGDGYEVRYVDCLGVWRRFTTTPAATDA